MTDAVGNDPGVAAFAVPSLANLRDIGGSASSFGGTIRTGVVFRSTDLSGVTDTDLDVLAALKITTVFDLRTVDERDQAPDRLPPGAKGVDLDVLADKDEGSIAAAMGDIAADPVQAARGFGGGRGEQFLLETYRDLVTLSSAQRSYRRMYLDIAMGDVPALIHCTTGKDRTGWAAAALLMFAGATEEDVFGDYMLTNESLLPMFEEMFVHFEKLGGDRSLLVPLLGVERKYLEAAIDEALRRYGTIDEYFASGLGLDDDSLQALRTRMIDAENTPPVE
ncbi:tyrosine-protein phosphatase [Rhodococcus sp. NPDC060086]|uniref:tyrosine-protein phosphatase n=1 Tax=Rhodococcus sp. NPDC060086 TaxID=3347055 RepID=UPI0036600FAD